MVYVNGLFFADIRQNACDNKDHCLLFRDLTYCRSLERRHPLSKRNTKTVRYAIVSETSHGEVLFAKWDRDWKEISKMGEYSVFSAAHFINAENAKSVMEKCTWMKNPRIVKIVVTVSNLKEVV